MRVSMDCMEGPGRLTDCHRLGSRWPFTGIIQLDATERRSPLGSATSGLRSPNSLLDVLPYPKSPLLLDILQAQNTQVNQSILTTEAQLKEMRIAVRIFWIGTGY